MSTIIIETFRLYCLIMRHASFVHPHPVSINTMVTLGFSTREIFLDLITAKYLYT